MYLNGELFIDFLAEKEISWLGIDFSLAKFSKSELNFSNEILQTLFYEWNMLVITDQKKYDIRMAFRKPCMNYDLSYITKLNKSVKNSSVIRPNIKLNDYISEDIMYKHIEAINCSTSAISKYALFFVVDSFDKASKTAFIWCVIIRQQPDKEVVLCEKFLETPSGMSVKSYWARTFYNLFFHIQKYHFVRWSNMVK